jgi:Ca2+-binding EF-hand superfamily protein
MKYKHPIICLAVATLIPALASAKPKQGPGNAFDRIDRNGDQVITINEATAADATRFIENFDVIDKDGNGEVTPTELTEHRKQRIGDRQARREAMDADANGAISYNEAVQGGARRLVDNFDRLDTDGDGEVTRDEMRKARQAMRDKRKQGKAL